MNVLASLVGIPSFLSPDLLLLVTLRSPFLLSIKRCFPVQVMWQPFLLSSQHGTVTSKQKNRFCNHLPFPTLPTLLLPLLQPQFLKIHLGSTECYCRRPGLRTFLFHEIAHPTSVNCCSAISVIHRDHFVQLASERCLACLGHFS